MITILKILIVEDLNTDVELIKREIKKSEIQFNEQIVMTKEDYIRSIQGFKPDIILSDYSLPTFNGMQALLIRNELAPSIPFILVTGSMNEETAVEVMKAGADDYVIKEHITRLGTAIKTTLEKQEIVRSKKEDVEKIKILSRAVEQNPASIIITDIDGLIEYVNPKFTQLTGYTMDEVIGKNPRILKSETTSSEEYKHLWEIITSGGEWSGEFQNRKKNGDIYFESASISPIMDQNGNITHFLAVKEDITQRKRTEEKLTWEQYLIHSLLDNIPDYIYFKDLESRFLRINKALAHVFNLDDPLMALGKSDNDFFKTEHSQQAFNDEQEIIRTGKPIIGKEEMETWFDRPPTWVSTTKMPLLDLKGKIIGTFGISRGITERIHAEQEIKTLSKAIEQSPTSIIITNAVGEIQFVNAKFSTFMQYSLDDVKGKNPRIFNPGHLSQDTYDLMWENLRSGKIWQGEFKNRKKDGTMFWENVIISPLVDNENIISNYILILEDITEKKEMLDDLILAKEKAEESDRLKTAFLQNISHEIRTPLNAIVGFSNILCNSELSSDKKKEFLNIIHVNTDQLLSIISGIIALATLEAGQDRIVEKETDINQMLKNIYEQFLVGQILPEVTFSYHPALPDEMAFAIIDPVKIMQILVNLVGNALKFTHKGTVRFGYELIDKEFQFFVEDTGIGIPEEMHELIFQRFRQVDNSSTRKYGGAGLGLAISKAYVELMGGSIKLTSAPGKGSVFSFNLPYKPVVRSKKDVLNNSKDQKSIVPPGKTILIAEDETDNYVLINELLTAMNLKVLRAENGFEAINICAGENAPDIIFMDIKMSEMDGIEATKKIRQINPEMPIIALTAYTLEFDKKRIIEAGCNDYLEKPIKHQVLLDILFKYLTV